MFEKPEQVERNGISVLVVGEEQTKAVVN